ncbi:hypothetical protein NKDENANG_03961 [Candidatus Entotheonellaceae bacterium PAL068K]
MTLIISTRHSLVRHAIVTMMVGIMTAGLPTVATSQYTWDTDAYDRSLTKNPPLDLNPKAVEEAQQRLEDHNRRAETESLVAPLAADRQQWQEHRAELDKRLQQLNAELNDAIAQARRDAKIRGWATFFQLVALGAAWAQQFVPQPPGAASADQTPTDLEPLADGLHMREQYQRVIEVCEGGTCQPVEIRQIINEALMPAGSGDSSDMRQMSSLLHQVASKLPSSNDVVIRYDIETESLSLQDVPPAGTFSSLASERPVSHRANTTGQPAIEAGVGAQVIKVSKHLAKVIKKQINKGKKVHFDTWKAHYNKHKNKFPEYKNAEEYRNSVIKFVKSPPLEPKLYAVPMVIPCTTIPKQIRSLLRINMEE